MDNPPGKFLGAKGSGSLHELLHGVDADDTSTPETSVVGDSATHQAHMPEGEWSLSVDPAAVERAKHDLAANPPPEIPERLDGEALPRRKQPKGNLG